MTALTQTRPSTEPALLDTHAVAALLGCSPRHVTRLRDAGLMPPAVRLGRLCRWPRAAIDAWVAAGCPGGDAAGDGRAVTKS